MLAAPGFVDLSGITPGLGWRGCRGGGSVCFESSEGRGGGGALIVCLSGRFGPGSSTTGSGTLEVPPNPRVLASLVAGIFEPC
jgi:hypothetical protein